MKRYDRRTFLKLSGASAMMLALAACDDSCSSGSTSSGSATETPPSPPIPVIRDGQKILTIFNAELARRKVENIKFEYSKGLEHAIQADVQMFVDNGSPEFPSDEGLRLRMEGDYYFAAFDLDGNELARSSQPVGSFDAVMMKRPNGYLLDTGYMWELYAPDGTFLEKSFPVGERETLCQLCGDFCTFDVFLPLEENAFLAVGHHGKATEPDEPVVFRITTDF